MTRRALEALLQAQGWTVTSCADGESAWEAYSEGRHPLVVLDWVLPEMDGLELCRRLRATPGGQGSIVIMVTAVDSLEALVAALEAGADDYIVKPVQRHLLEVRLIIAEERLQARAERFAAERDRENLIVELREALGRIRTLRGLIPICSSCKKIRDDQGFWEQIEVFIRDQTDAEFSHGLCPDCAKRLYPEILGHPDEGDEF